MAARTSKKRQRRSDLIGLRVNEGWSRADLAYRIGRSAETVRLAELGFIPGPGVQYDIAKAFGMRPLDLWPIERQRVAA